MYRGTTPTLTFNMPFGSDGIESLYITFEQNSETVLEKTEADIVWQDNAIELGLTQEETLNFKSGQIKIQIRVKFTNEQAIASNVMYTTAEAILKDGVI